MNVVQIEEAYDDSYVLLYEQNSLYFYSSPYVPKQKRFLLHMKNNKILMRDSEFKKEIEQFVMINPEEMIFVVKEWSVVVIFNLRTRK